MILHCIRHAESVFNAQGRIQGHLNVELSELGRRQSEALAAAVAKLPIEAIFSSPLARARQTAEPIARALGLPIQIVPELIEINAGIFQGKRRDELDRLCPEEIARWRSGEPDYVVPGGESRRQLMIRGAAVLRELAGRPYRQVVVMSHGGLIGAALKMLLEIPAHRYPFVLENASITRVEIDGPRVLLLSLNQVEHLGDVGLAGAGDL